MVAPAVRSPGAQHKAQGEPVYPDMSGLLDLATIVKSRVLPRLPLAGNAHSAPHFDIITTPTTIQRRAFELLDVVLK